MSLNSQITYLMKIAIEVNKKTGGTRAYGNTSSMQKQKRTVEISLLLLDSILVKTSTLYAPNLTKGNGRRGKMRPSLTLKSGKRQRKSIINWRECGSLQHLIKLPLYTVNYQVSSSDHQIRPYRKVNQANEVIARINRHFFRLRPKVNKQG